MRASSRVSIIDPKALNESLSSLTFHASPPPSLTARFPIEGERPAPKLKLDEEDGRTSAPVEADPEGAITSVSHWPVLFPVVHTRHEHLVRRLTGSLSRTFSARITPIRSRTS